MTYQPQPPRSTVYAPQWTRPDFSSTFTIKTQCFPDGRIEESISPSYSPFQELTKFILNTREEHVRKSLIALGWTPPGEAPPAPAEPLPGAGADALLGLTLAVLRSFIRTVDETVGNPDRNHRRGLEVALSSIGDYAQHTLDRVATLRRPDTSNSTT